MITTRKGYQGLNIISLGKRIGKANALIPRQFQWLVYRVALIISDIVMIDLALRLAYYFRFEAVLNFFDERALVSIEYYRWLVVLSSSLWLFIFALNGLYSTQNLLGGTREYSKIFRSSTAGFLLIVIAGFLQPSLLIARGWLLMAWGFTFLFAVVGRFVLRRLVYFLRRYGFFLTSAVIVGANQEGRWLTEQLLRWESSGLHLVGFVDKKEPVATPLFHNLVCLGSVDQLGEIVERYHVGEVILASSAISTRDYLPEIFRNYGISDKVNLRLSSGLYEVITTGLTVNEFACVPLVYVNKVRLTGSNRLLKFVLDYVITIISLVFSIPLLLLIGLLIKLGSPGPVIHKRRVLGLNGKQFYALKFRTMVVDGDEIMEQHPELKEDSARTHKLKSDPHVTPIGAFLRKYSLDELPQLLNVLKRDMSLVGPRTISPEEVTMYKQFDMNLLTMLPGITGLRQVSGRSDISYDERVLLDMYYVRNWSIWLDLQLLFQTIPAVLKRRGTY